MLGLRLFRWRHYVRSVLHVYHILNELIGFTSILSLEQLCTSSKDVIFPGGRPSRSFKACCVSFVGTRLRFKPDESDHKSGSHHMAVQAHTAKAAAGFGLRKDNMNESLWSRTPALGDPRALVKDNKRYKSTRIHHKH